MPKKPVKNIEDETSIMPWLLAETAIESTPGTEALTFEEIRAYGDALADTANAIYKANPAFRKKIKGPRGNAGRDRLYAFMQHWFAPMLKKDHPDIYRRVKRLAPGYGWSKVY